MTTAQKPGHRIPPDIRPGPRPDDQRDMLVVWAAVVVVVVITLTLTLVTLHPGMLDPVTEVIGNV